MCIGSEEVGVDCCAHQRFQVTPKTEQLFSASKSYSSSHSPSEQYPVYIDDTFAAFSRAKNR